MVKRADTGHYLDGSLEMVSGKRRDPSHKLYEHDHVGWERALSAWDLVLARLVVHI